jgi:hypothetical protein
VFHEIFIFQYLLGQNRLWIEDEKSVCFGNRLICDFRATFSSLFKGFWSMNFVGLDAIFFREKIAFSLKFRFLCFQLLI